MKLCSFGQKKDRISYLPDPIRSHIISFLSTKEAMRTSILSRRWEHICSSLSNMEFHQSDFLEKGNKAGEFKTFVDELLFRHDGSDIRKFSLKTKISNVSISSRHINAWISFALRHNVQDLDLCIPVGRPVKLPLRLFVCNTLTVLHFYCMEIEWPTNIKLPVLKSFTCEDVNFLGENVNKVISKRALPVLEQLTLIWCFLNVESLSISIPTLKHLIILEGNDTELSVSNSALQEIEYWGLDPPKISSEILSSLTSATFHFLRYFESSDEVAKYCNFSCASKLLTGLHNVVTLHLSSGFIEFLSKDKDLLASLPNWSRGPKHLGLDLLPAGVHLQVIMILVESFCDLQTVLLYVDESEEISSTMMMEPYWKKKEMPAADIFNQLRTVTIKNFGGCVPELDMVKYFFEEAKFLDEMIIMVSTTTNNKVVGSSMRIDEILSTFPKVSPNVRVSIL